MTTDTHDQPESAAPEREASECSGLLSAAQTGAKWMRWWLEQNECECEAGHSCGKPERMRELEQMERAIADAEVMGLDERMKKAGMMPVSEMLERSQLGKFEAHAGVTDLEWFEQWIQKRRAEFLRMQARMTLDGAEKDELFEWVVAYNAVLGEVMANFRQATGRTP